MIKATSMYIRTIQKWLIQLFNSSLHGICCYRPHWEEVACCQGLQMTRGSGVERKVGHGVERRASISMTKPSSIMMSQTEGSRACGESWEPALGQWTQWQSPASLRPSWFYNDEDIQIFSVQKSSSNFGIQLSHYVEPFLSHDPRGPVKGRLSDGSVVFHSFSGYLETNNLCTYKVLLESKNKEIKNERKNSNIWSRICCTNFLKLRIVYIETISFLISERQRRNYRF